MMKQTNMKRLYGALCAAGLLLPVSMVQAQADCGAGANPGDVVNCTSSGVAQTALITIFAAADGETNLVVDSRRGTAAGTGSGVLLRGSGSGRINVSLEAHMRAGTIDFSANSGGVDFTVPGYPLDDAAPGGWAMNGQNRFGSGDDHLHNLAGSVLTASNPERGFPQDDRSSLVETRLDFGSGNDRFTNRGVLIIGESRVNRTLQSNGTISMEPNSARHPQAHQFSVNNLETMVNSGRIMLGGWVDSGSWRPFPELYGMTCQFNASYPHAPARPCELFFGDADRKTVSVLSLPGVHFIAEPGSELFLDARFDRGLSQYDCQQRSLRSGLLSLPAADCMEIIGGQTEGVTEVIVRDGLPGSLGAHNADGIVIVDVGGGQTAAEHFVLSAESDDYNPDTGTLDKGMFMFGLAFNAADNTHRLVSMPSVRAHRLPLLVQAVQAISRTTSRPWFERRGDGRGRDAELPGGAWVRLSQDNAQRTADQSTGGVHFNNDHDIDSTVFSIGRDLRVGTAWVLGGSASYIDAAVDFDHARAAVDFGGAALGLHAGYAGADGLWFDSQVQLQWLEMDYMDAYFPTTLDNATQTIDVRAELGWRLTLSDALYVEPMIGASWVRSEFDSMQIQAPLDPTGRPDGLLFGDASSSMRATLGGRLHYRQPVAGLQVGYTLSTRYWHSLKDDTRVTMRNAGPTVTVSDDFDAGLFEVGAGVEVSNDAGNVGATLQAHGMFGDYESLGITAGLQLRW